MASLKKGWRNDRSDVEIEATKVDVTLHDAAWAWL
jgi:hypothetical protein